MAEATDGDGIQQEAELDETTYDWTYDSVGRLTDEAITHFDSGISQAEHFEYDLTGNRTRLEKDSGYTGTFSPDEVFTYDYDANDRLIFEWLNNDADAEVDQTTEYGYDHTQQSSKAVYGGFVGETTPQGSYPVTTGRQLFAYNFQGRMSSVINEGYNTSGVLTSRERTSYEYASKSFRVELVTETDSALNGTYTLVSRTEFLADHHNHTGYAQAIRETTYDAAGAVTKQVDYTFGHDEISQTVTEGGTTATHVFGHDGHGSVRVLYDLAETTANLIEQAFTFAAYGEMLAVHSSAGDSSPLATRLSSLGYSGEHFDAKAQQQYLRARWYDPANGRFNRLDPFAGNMQDPQSLHKYAYVHGDPANMADPTGMFGVAGSLGATGIALNLTLNTLVQGGLIILTLKTIGSTGAQLRNTGITLLAAGEVDAGLLLYDMGNRIFKAATDVVETTTAGLELFAIGVAVVDLGRLASRFVSSGGPAHVLTAIRTLATRGRQISISDFARATRIGSGNLNGFIAPPQHFVNLQDSLSQIRSTANGESIVVRIRRVPRAQLDAEGVIGKYDYVASNGVNRGTVTVANDATYYEINHELQHLFHHIEIGNQYGRLTRQAKELHVYEQQLNSPYWKTYSNEEQIDAYTQVMMAPNIVN